MMIIMNSNNNNGNNNDNSNVENEHKNDTCNAGFRADKRESYFCKSFAAGRNRIEPMY